MGLGYWFDPLGKVRKLIGDWRPRRCTTEKDYERSLVRYLQEKLEGKDVVPQYASGRVRGDIVVEGQILIEIKTKLDSTAKLQKLLGQIEVYESEWKKQVIVVICGENDPNLAKQLRDSAERRRPLLGDPWLRLVFK
jgi:hypothetical protein